MWENRQKFWSGICVNLVLRCQHTDAKTHGGSDRRHPSQPIPGMSHRQQQEKQAQRNGSVSRRLSKSRFDFGIPLATAFKAPTAVVLESGGVVPRGPIGLTQFLAILSVRARTLFAVPSACTTRDATAKSFRIVYLPEGRIVRSFA